jgi:hypothetical protein
VFGLYTALISYSLMFSSRQSGVLTSTVFADGEDAADFKSDQLLHT